jgi:hypothetical protein
MYEKKLIGGIKDEGNLKNLKQEIAIYYMSPAEGLTPKISVEISLAENGEHYKPRSFRTEKPWYIAKLSLLLAEAFTTLLKNTDKHTARYMIAYFENEMKKIIDAHKRIIKEESIIEQYTSIDV